MRRPISPETAGSERKRRRKVLSCYDCRRRKLQCDRQLPACGRCAKAGQAVNCLYIDDPAEGPLRPDGDGGVALDAHIPSSTQQQAWQPSGDTLTRLEYQERRIKQLEAALAQAGHPQSGDPHAPDPLQRIRHIKQPLTPESVACLADQGPGNATDSETILLRGKSFKTQYHGSTHPGALIAHISGLHVFTKETFERFPALAKIKHSMQALEDRTGHAGMQPHLHTDEELKAMLPPKEEVDPLLQMYFRNYGSIYHIVHTPSFWKEYHAMWNNFEQAKAHFVALVLLMTASVQCLTSQQSWLYAANSSTAREKAVTYIQAVDGWLQSKSQKHVTSTDFQIRFLLLLARQVNARKCKRMWTDAGNLLRFCMAAGLHRSGTHLRKPTSALDKELRKRIWAAIVELELQSSFDRGMVAGQWTLQADCPEPCNIHDEDIDQETELLPPLVPASEFTSSSYLSMASESTLLRHGLNTSLNSIRQTLSFDDVRRFSDEIEKQISAIPDWQVEGADVPQALLVLNLRQYLLLLYDRQIRQANSTSKRSFARMMIVDNATRIIDTHRKLINKGCCALELLCIDQLRAALSICQVATTVDLKGDGAFAQVIEQHADKVMEEAIQMLTDKVLRFGREQRQLWIALAAHGFWKAKKDPAKRVVYMQDAVDKVTRPFYKTMAFQETAAIASSAAHADPPKSNQDNELPNGGSGHLPPASPAKTLDIADVGDTPILDLDIDLDDLEAWTFENWTFNPTELQQAFVPPYPSVHQ